MRAALVLLAFLSVGCSSERTPTTPTPPAAEMAAAVRTYLDEVLRIMQGSSINRLTIDWNSLRSEVVAAAGAAQSVADAMPAIRVALTRLGDGHSFYRTPAGTTLFVPTRSCSGSGGPSADGVPPAVGYVSVGAFSGSLEQAAAFADAIQDRIRASDRDDLVGWVVDLRGNGGGNMWPMIAGVGPIVGEALLGYFIGPAGETTPWEYRSGASWSGGRVAQRVTAPYRLRREQPRVAVLSDNGVASSGEATLIAFRQRPNTRSFGVASCGLSTANSTFTLSDGATLTLTVAVMADRTGARYGDQVIPDEILSDRVELIRRAVEWLQRS
jgi:hypothetical protein